MNYKIAQSIGVNPILMAESNYKDAYYYIFVRFLNKYANEKDQIEGYKKLYKTKLGLNTTRKIPPIISIEKAFEKIKRLTIVNGEIVDFKFILFVDIVNVLAVNDKEFAITILQDYVSYFEQYERNQFNTLFSCMFSEDENLSFKKKIELLYKKLNDDVRNSFFTLIKALVIFLFFYNFTLATVLVCGIIYLVRKKSSKKFISNLKTAIKRLNRISYDLKISKMLDSKLINEIKVSDYSDKNIAEYFINTNEAVQHFGLIPILSIWNANNRFFARKETRVLITANMSAGKSTLINAIVGKYVNKTLNDSCTAKIHYLNNKPVEDKLIGEYDYDLELDAPLSLLMEDHKQNNSTKINVVTKFRTVNAYENPFCLIDTPGVNSAQDIEHKKISQNAIKNLDYDVLLVLLNGENIGTDDEKRHLEFILNNHKGKCIFLINKLDRFKTKYYSIEDTLSSMIKELISIGFKAPCVYPISSYAAFLAKKSLFGEDLNEDEQDEIDFFYRKFSKNEFMFEKYYPKIKNTNDELMNKDINLLVKSGLYPLEKMLESLIA